VRLIHDLDVDAFPDTIQADVCIIGAGAAGLTVAVELAERGVDVILLESGGSGRDPAMQDFNRVQIVGHPHHGAFEGRYRALGGTTTLWGGQMVPLQPIDFEKRTWIPWSGWPIRYGDMIPYYESALQAVALGDSLQADSEVWAHLGLEAPHLGHGIEPYFSRWCPVPNFAHHFGRKLSTLQSLRCILHATVVGFDAHAEATTDAFARSVAGQEVRVRCRYFVLCVGAIETARILLQPLGDGQPAPWADLDLIGRFFQDHPVTTSADILPRNRRVIHNLFDNAYHRGLRYQPRFRLTDAQQRQEQLPGVGGVMTFRSNRIDTLRRTRDVGKSLLSGHFSRDVGTAALASTRNAPLLARLAWRTLIQHRSYNPDDLGIRLEVQLEQVPSPDSCVSLDDQADALGLRRARLDWRVGGREVESIARFSEIVKAAFEGVGLADVRIDPDVAARNPKMLTRTVDQLHHMGTARMAVTPAEGVLDPNLRVFGQTNLYVCSSAAFPTSGHANPTHTIIALALRLTDHLHERLARG
jgi:choline dehydrogenase-like flavoprotein